MEPLNGLPWPKNTVPDKVTPEMVAKYLDAAESQEHTFWNKELVVSYRLENGFTISGRGACVNPANFNLELGRKIARKHAEEQLFLLLGFSLQQLRYQAGLV